MASDEQENIRLAGIHSTLITEHSPLISASYGAEPNEYCCSAKKGSHVQISELRYRTAIRFAIGGDVRFISHHDTMRMFERALARTDLPVRFSEGFNPRPKLSLPLPRPVGIATVADVLVVELTQPVAGEEIARQLSAQMPQGVILGDTWVPSSSRALQAETASYALDLPTDLIAGVFEQLSRVLAAQTWSVHREEDLHGPSKTLDLREHLVEAGIESASLQWTLRVMQAGSIRPSEALAAFGLEPSEWQHRIRRTAVKWAEPVRLSEADHPVVEG